MPILSPVCVCKQRLVFPCFGNNRLVVVLQLCKREGKVGDEQKSAVLALCKLGRKVRILRFNLYRGNLFSYHSDATE